MTTAAPILDHSDHTYTIGGKPLVSVTAVIDTLIKKYDGVSQETLDNAAVRGQLTEKYATEILKNGYADIPAGERQDVDSRVDCFYRWYERKKPELIDAQRCVWSEADGVAGTLDFLLKIDGFVCLVDLKCTSAPQRWWPLQLGAYSSMSDAGHTATAVLHLNPEYKDGYIWRKYDPIVIQGQWFAAVRWFRVLQALKAEAA